MNQTKAKKYTAVRYLMISQRTAVFYIVKPERVMQLKKISEKSEHGVISHRRKGGLFIPKNHPCYGCVWYPRDVDVLFCPFQSCVRHKKGFTFRKEQTDGKTG